MEKIRVLLVDDHTILREGLKALLNLCEDIEVVAEASEGREALAYVRRYTPDVVVMDMAMPGMGGLEATRRIVEENPHELARKLVVAHRDLAQALEVAYLRHTESSSAGLIGPFVSIG